MTRLSLSDVRVVVDTNVLSHGSGLNDRSLTGLQDLAREGASVIVPAPVVLELARHLADSYRKARQALKPALATQRALGLRTPSLEECLGDPGRDWEGELRSALSRFATLPAMPNVPHERLVRRDLGREHPFKESGAGYRDALIWESVIDAAEPGLRTAFVTANHRDFGTGSPDHPITKDLPQEMTVAVLGKLSDVRPWLTGSTSQPMTSGHTEAPLPFSAISAELSDLYFGTATGVRFGTRLRYDADVDYIEEWVDLVDSTEYSNVDEHTGSFEAVIAGEAHVSTTVPRDVLGLLDDDVSIDKEADADEATVSCRRPVLLTASVQYRLDTMEVLDVEEHSLEYRVGRS